MSIDSSDNDYEHLIEEQYKFEKEKYKQLKIALDRATDLLKEKDKQIADYEYALTEGDQYTRNFVVKKWRNK